MHKYMAIRHSVNDLKHIIRRRQMIIIKRQKVEIQNNVHLCITVNQRKNIYTIILIRNNKAFSVNLIYVPCFKFRKFTCLKNV